MIKPIMMVLLLAWSQFCGASGLSNGEIQENDDYSKAIACSREIKKILHAGLSDAPDFKTIHEMTGWLEDHLPTDIKRSFIESSRPVSVSLAKWEDDDAIHGPFSNIQLITELLYAQSAKIHGSDRCRLVNSPGLSGEIVSNQIFIAMGMDLKKKSVMNSLARLGVSDQFYVEKILMYGVILDLAEIAWTDEQLAKVAKYRPPESL